MLPTIAREDDVVVMIDQRKLPAEEVYVRCATAAEVARAQAIAAKTGSAGRYGYASLPERAPHAAWSDVLEDSLARSRMRINGQGRSIRTPRAF